MGKNRKFLWEISQGVVKLNYTNCQVFIRESGKKLRNSKGIKPVCVRVRTFALPISLPLFVSQNLNIPRRRQSIFYIQLISTRQIGESYSFSAERNALFLVLLFCICIYTFTPPLSHFFTFLLCLFRSFHFFVFLSTFSLRLTTDVSK